ncbi:unnamed protein product [Callosobruchus maculatus]|uniref:Uncharacterized protein n=1 Tax=Callosobruchus maculatus TaxID=64391 RepID=A0A653CXT2_CALMS|nr:unnamed protein product [Callosobruchus maculatus]
MVLRCARRRRRIKALECRIRPPIVARQSTDTSSQAQKHRRRDPRSTSREILTRRTRAVNWVLSVAGTQLPTHLRLSTPPPYFDNEMADTAGGASDTRT